MEVLPIIQIGRSLNFFQNFGTRQDVCRFLGFTMMSRRSLRKRAPLTHVAMKRNITRSILGSKPLEANREEVCMRRIISVPHWKSMELGEGMLEPVSKRSFLRQLLRKSHAASSLNKLP